MLNQLQRGDEPALLPCRRSGFLRRPELGKKPCPMSQEDGLGLTEPQRLLRPWLFELVHQAANSHELGGIISSVRLRSAGPDRPEH
jgi:hypothetical protein